MTTEELLQRIEDMRNCENCTKSCLIPRVADFTELTVYHQRQECKDSNLKDWEFKRRRKKP